MKLPGLVSLQRPAALRRFNIDLPRLGLDPMR